MMEQLAYMIEQQYDFVMQQLEVLKKKKQQ